MVSFVGIELDFAAKVLLVLQNLGPRTCREVVERDVLASKSSSPSDQNTSRVEQSRIAEQSIAASMVCPVRRRNQPRDYSGNSTCFG